MSVKSIVSEINRIEDRKELEEILQVTRRAITRLNTQLYQSDLDEAWNAFVSTAKRGNIVKVSVKEGTWDNLQDGDELEIFDITSDVIVVKSIRLGRKFHFGPDQILKYGLGKKEIPAVTEDPKPGATG